MNHTIHVTGCAGFVGSALGKELQRRPGLALSGSDRGVALGSIYRDCQSFVAIEDIGPDTDWSRALKGADTVIHLAARAHVMRESVADPLAEFRKVNRDGALNLAMQAISNGVRRLVFMSTIGVNGEITGDGQRRDGCSNSFSEEDNPQPHSDYAVAKREAEQRLADVACKYGMELVIVRAPLVYGPGVKGNVHRLLRLIHRGIPLPFGLVKNQRSFMGVSNLVDLLIRCAVEPAAANQLFVVADGEDVSTPELIRRISHSLGRDPRLMPVPVELLRWGSILSGKQKMFQQLCGSLTVDASKVRGILGWTPPLTMDQELQRTAKWFQESLKS